MLTKCNREALGTTRDSCPADYRPLYLSHPSSYALPPWIGAHGASWDPVHGHLASPAATMDFYHLPLGAFQRHISQAPRTGNLCLVNRTPSCREHKFGGLVLR